MQKIQPIGLLGWRAATNAPVAASARACRPYKTVSKSGSCPRESGTITTTNTVVAASMTQGSRTFHGATGRTAVEVMATASPTGVRFALRTRKRDETGAERPYRDGHGAGHPPAGPAARGPRWRTRVVRDSQGDGAARPPGAERSPAFQGSLVRAPLSGPRSRTARGALRRTLSTLRSGIGEAWLETSAAGVELRRQRGLVVDVERFRSMVGSEAPRLRAWSRASSCVPVPFSRASR